MSFLTEVTWMDGVTDAWKSPSRPTQDGVLRIQLRKSNQLLEAPLVVIPFNNIRRLTITEEV